MENITVKCLGLSLGQISYQKNVFLSKTWNLTNTSATSSSLSVAIVGAIISALVVIICDKLIKFFQVNSPNFPLRRVISMISRKSRFMTLRGGQSNKLNKHIQRDVIGTKMEHLNTFRFSYLIG